MWRPNTAWMSGSHSNLSWWTATRPTTRRSWRKTTTPTAAALRFPTCRPPRPRAPARWTVNPEIPESVFVSRDFKKKKKRWPTTSLPLCPQVSVRPAKTSAWSPWQQSPSKSRQASSWSVPSPPASRSTSWCASWTGASCLTRMGKMHFWVSLFPSSEIRVTETR